MRELTVTRAFLTSTAASALAVIGLLAVFIHELAISGPIVVIDGDTVDRGVARYRLVGFDAPEIRQAQCPEERTLGLAAARRLRELVASGKAQLVPDRRQRDKYGRGLARLVIDGRDAGELLISEGLARPYDGRSRRQSWCD